MNKKGFTLVELLATIVILGIVVGLSFVGINGAFKNAKEKSEDAFIATIEDALKIYLDTGAKKLREDSSFSPITINKTHGIVTVSKLRDPNGNTITFNNVIDSDGFNPITIGELVNPANKDTDRFQCSADGTLNIYRDSDFVYYYLIDKDGFGCFNTTGYITNLPCDALNKMNDLEIGKIPSRCK